MRLGEALLKRDGPNKVMIISQKMRQLAQLKQQLWKSGEDTALPSLDLLSPQYFGDVVAAIESLCAATRSDTAHNVFGKPSFALKIGQSILRCCNLKRGIGIR